MNTAHRGWTPADIGNLEDRTVIVTGASSGIGAATAQALAAAGARVIAAVRDLGKGRHIGAGMRGHIEVRHLDLSDLPSVRRFAAGIHEDIDVLVNNAGVMGVPHARTVDGFELHIGTNHLGPFALTGLVLPRLRDRVVTVSSQAHRQGRLRLDDLHAERGRYDASAAYAASKLANLLFAYQLHRRLQAAGSPLRSLAAHPGLAQSNLLHQAAPTLRLRITAFAQRRLGQPTAAGALPLLYAATADLPSGCYVGPDGFYQLRGHPTLVDSSSASKDPSAAAALWDLSEQMTGTAFDFATARRV